jgi:hypothetical protein
MRMRMTMIISAVTIYHYFNACLYARSISAYKHKLQVNINYFFYLLAINFSNCHLIILLLFFLIYFEFFFNSRAYLKGH